MPRISLVARHGIFSNKNWHRFFSGVYAFSKSYDLSKNLPKTEKNAKILNFQRDGVGWVGPPPPERDILENQKVVLWNDFTDLIGQKMVSELHTAIIPGCLLSIRFFRPISAAFSMEAILVKIPLPLGSFLTSIAPIYQEVYNFSKRSLFWLEQQVGKKPKTWLHNVKASRQRFFDGYQFAVQTQIGASDLSFVLRKNRNFLK